MDIDTINLSVPIIRIFLTASIVFGVAIILTPIMTHFLYKFKFYQQIREAAVTGEASSVFSKLHEAKAHTPTMGGVIIWGSVSIVILALYVVFQLLGGEFLHDLNFLSRSQTWLPLAALVLAGMLGAFDDFLNIKGKSSKKGMGVKWKFIWQIAIGALVAWWFYYKLGFSIVHIPAVGDFDIGILYILLAIFVIVATTNAVNITDGLDGLAAGVLLTCFVAFGGIAFVTGKIELAMFCGAISGALLAFLWFNIYPARFFMGDTGALALGATLGVVALLLNSVLVLPIIGFILVAETASSLIQIISKKFFNKKVFLVAPLHHHFEAKGWPEPKITMRFWVISSVFALIGMVLGIIGRG